MGGAVDGGHRWNKLGRPAGLICLEVFEQQGGASGTGIAKTGRAVPDSGTPK